MPGTPSGNLEDIAARLAQLSTTQRAQLEKLVQQRQLNQPSTRLSPRADKSALPLSFAQEGLWFLNHLAPTLYNRPVALRLRGALNIDILGHSLNAVIQRHEVLRSVYPSVEGQPHQEILLPLTINLPLIDLTHLIGDAQNSESQRLLKYETNQPFDLVRGPLLRAALFVHRLHDHVLLVTFHHIVFDGWSAQIFVHELTALYASFNAGETPLLGELPIQYADYASWQRQQVDSPALRSQLTYWKQQLAGEPTLLQLPIDRSRPQETTYASATHSLTVDVTLTERLQALSRQYNATLFMTLLAAIYTLLYRYTGQEDIWLGSPTAGRTQTETEKLIGNFLNILVLRAPISADLTFEELLGRVRKVALDAYTNADLPFERLVQELRPQRNGSNSPFFQLLFNFENVPEMTTAPVDLQITALELGPGTTAYDLSLEIIERQSRLDCQFVYNTTLFNTATIERMAGHFATLLTAIVANPQQEIATFPLLTDAERHQLLVTFNDTDTEYSRDRTIHALFEDQVQRTPDSIALIFGDQQLTYAELDRRANRVAHYLRSLPMQSIQPDTVIGVCLPSSTQLIVAILGILKAGAAYLPLDPVYPAQRLTYMLNDAQAPLLLTEQGLDVNLSDYQGQISYLDLLIPVIDSQPDSRVTAPTQGSDLAYMIYTSGSTGMPKGVLIEHHSLVNYVQFVGRFCPVQPSDRIFLTSSIGFDFSVAQIFGMLAHGGTLILRPDWMLGSVPDFLRECTESGITILEISTGYWHELVLRMDEDNLGLPPRIHLIIAGAERMLPERLALWWQLVGDRVTLMNAYGPTEATIAVTFGDIVTDAPIAQTLREVLSGWPIANTQLYILDANMQPVPLGLVGELYIAGVALARGYWRRPELTAERFVANPFSAEAGSRLYRSGDLARFRTDGSIEILGRVDTQVKIRGFRIELGEIEATLLQQPQVQESIVHVHTDQDGEKRIVAYIVLKVLSADPSAITHRLRDVLAEKLPKYMIPAAFVVMEVLPLNRNGKIDRQALPAPEAIREPTLSFAAPRSEIEVKLVELWQDLLHVQPIGIHDNFFELGGHSMLVIRLIAHIHKTFGKKLPVATLFKAATIEQLAAVLGHVDDLKIGNLIQIQKGDSKPPLFCIHPLGGGVYTYRTFAQYLGQNQPVYGLQAPGIDGLEPPLTRIEDMAALYIREIRTVQPNGPFFLCGYSFGGTPAIEIAYQLEQQGQKVAVLALIDTQLYRSGSRADVKAETAISKTIRQLIHLFSNVGLLPWRYKLLYLVQRVTSLFRKRIPKDLSLDERLNVTPAIKAIRESNTLAHRNYSPKPYYGRLIFLRAKQPIIYIPQFREIRHLARGGVDFYDVPGDHLTVFDEPNIRVVAKVLRHCLDKEYAQLKP